MDLMVQKYRSGKERYIKQINDTWECQKKMAELDEKRSCLKRIKGCNIRKERGGSRHSC